MSERIVNINGILYVSRVNENGIYMVRVNADGSDWVNAPQLTEAERAAGISLGPTNIEVASQEQAAAARPNIFKRAKKWLLGR